MFSDNLYYLEIFNVTASKKTAVKFLREKYGFERIVGFGDNHNDLPMFEACDVRVAVNNATSNVKDIADFICDSNEEDGVAKWIKTNIR